MNIFRQKTKKVDDDLFIRRLRSSVLGEGMLVDGNIYLIDYAIRNLPQDAVIVEIGIYGGVSTNLICYLSEKHNKKTTFFNCDPWIYEGYDDRKDVVSEYIDGRNDILRVDFMNYVKESYIRSITFLTQKLPHTIQAKADDFFELWEQNAEVTDVFNRNTTLGGTIHFAYIDGDHSYKTAKSDFENVSRHMAKGGYILFDDSHDALDFGSAKLMKEILANKDFRLVLKNPNYLFQKIN